MNPERVEELVAQLRPEGFLEETIATEIIWATLRLSQVDRSDAERVIIANTLRRNTAELRRLQTDRHLKAEFQLDLPGLISAKDVLRLRRNAAKNEKKQIRKNEPISQVAAASLSSRIEAEQAQLLEKLKKRTHSEARKPAGVPRNTPCPCKSGQKYKRCCGSGAPPQYNLSPQEPGGKEALMAKGAQPVYNQAA
jgi:hypothetical protein